MNKTKSKKEKKATSSEATETKTSGKCMNYGKCCTCKYYPSHKRGEAMPCKVSKKYVARKAEHPECYKCKY